MPLLPPGNSMASSEFNIVDIDATAVASVVNVEMVDCEENTSSDSDKNNGVENVLTCNSDNNDVARSTASTESLLLMAAENGGKCFNIFLQSTDSKSIPNRDPRAVQTEIRSKIPHANHIENVRHTRTGSLLISTKDVSCAAEICQVTSFLGVSVKHRVIWENISNRFLVFNVPVDFPLEEVGQEIMVNNNVQILEMRRFKKKDSSSTVSPVLITSLGIAIPAEIKLWFTLQRIRQFVDRPRQCARCFKFNHATGKCQSEQICATCGLKHSGPCTSEVKCVNCGEGHRADYLQCPTRTREMDFLRFKSGNFLSFTDARRKFTTRVNSESYAQKTKVKKPDQDEIKKAIEIRTNNMLKILVDHSDKQFEKILETISALSNIVMNCLAKLSDKSPERKRAYVHGKGG